MLRVTVLLPFPALDLQVDEYSETRLIQGKILLSKHDNLYEGDWMLGGYKAFAVDLTEL